MVLTKNKSLLINLINLKYRLIVKWKADIYEGKVEHMGAIREEWDIWVRSDQEKQINI